MARCGCQSAACNCVVQAGPGATVTGDGSAANPYVVSAVTGGKLLVQDSDTIDHSLAGDGSTATPYVLTSVAKVSPDADNILTTTPNGLKVDCDAVAACAPPAGAIALGCGLEGTGAPESPMRLKGTVPFADEWACPESNATSLYCAADGSLVGPPPNTCATAQVGLGPLTGMAGFCGLVPATATRTRLSTQPNRMNFNNPDPCREMILELKASGVIYMTGDGADGTNPVQWTNQIVIGLMINGATGAGVQQHGIQARGFITYRIDYPVVTIPPGGAVQIGSFVDGQVDVACHVENSVFQHPNIIAVGRTCG
jgi:hypothetical protein